MNSSLYDVPVGINVRPWELASPPFNTTVQYALEKNGQYIPAHYNGMEAYNSANVNNQGRPVPVSQISSPTIHRFSVNKTGTRVKWNSSKNIKIMKKSNSRRNRKGRSTRKTRRL